MTTKHTPANWLVTGNSIDGFVIREEKTNVIVFESNRYLIQAEANAKLIAASPEMLDALIDAFELIAGDSDVSHFDTIDKMKYAIAKATGEN